MSSKSFCFGGSWCWAATHFVRLHAASLQSAIVPLGFLGTPRSHLGSRPTSSYQTKNLMLGSNHSVWNVVVLLTYVRITLHFSTKVCSFLLPQAAVAHFPLAATAMLRKILTTVSGWFAHKIKSNIKRTSYDVLFMLAPDVGLEPTTLRLTAACSANGANQEYVSTRLSPIG